MDFVHSTNAAEVPKRSRGKRLTVGLGACLASLAGLVLLAPTVLSMGWARERIVAMANTALAPARVEVADWSLGWFAGQRLTGVTYTDSAQGIQAQVKELRLSSLWQLLPLGKITAEVTVDSPVVHMEPVEAAIKPVAPTAPKGSAPATPSPATERAPFILPAWEIAARVVVLNGQVTHAGFAEPLLSAARCEIVVPGLNHAIALDLETKVLDAKTSVKATLPSVEALLQAKRPADFLTQAVVRVKAPWATLTLDANAPEGAAEASPYPTATMALKVALPQAVARARSLGVELPRLEVRAGELLLSGNLTAAPSEQCPALQQVSLGLSVREVDLSHAGKALKLAPQAQLVATLDPQNLLASATLQQLSVDLPGLTASGKGSLTEGTLSAQLDLATLLETFRPFVGAVTLPQPLALRLDATAAAQAIKLSAKATAQQQEVATLGLELQGLDLATQTFRQATLNSSVDLARAIAFAPLPNNQQLAGTLIVNGSAAGAFTAFKSKLLVGVQNAVYRAASWNVSEPKLLTASATVDVALGRGVQVANLALETPAGKLSGSAELPFGGAPTLVLSGTMVPDPVLGKWRVWGKDESPVAVTGEVAVTANLAQSVASLKLAGKPFTLTWPGQEPVQLPFTLDAQLPLDSPLTLRQLVLETPYLGLSAAGTYGDNHLKMAGELTPNITRAFAELPLFAEMRTFCTINGCETRPFTFEAPLGEGLPGILNQGVGSAEVAVERITVPGLDIPSGNLKASLKDGVVALDGSVAVNGGSVNLHPRVALASKPYLVTMPDGTALLKNVGLTKELLNTLLRSVNPLLQGYAEPRGSIDLICDNFSLPLTTHPISDLVATLTFYTHGCGLAPDGPLGNVLAATKVGGETIDLPDQNFKVTVEQSKLLCDEITFRVETVRMICTGETDLQTQAIDYTLTLPLTKELLGKKFAKYLEAGKELKLPISGTVQAPVVQTDALLATLRDAATDGAFEKATEALNKGLDRLFKEDKKQAKDPAKQSDKERRKDSIKKALRGFLGR